MEDQFRHRLLLFGRITMTKSEIYYFLGKCLALGENEENDRKISGIISQKEVDWARFVALGSNHLVLPSVYLRFKRYGIQTIIPEELSEHLRMVYELNYNRNRAVLQQIDCINCLFASAGIVPIYLKGAGNLLDRLYEDEGERMMSDIDLLVSDDEFLRAANLLKGKGYEHAAPFYDDSQYFTKHYPRLHHPNEYAGIEVHRLPVETDLSSHFNYAVIKPETKWIDSAFPCLVLSDRHKVIQNFMHGFMANDVRLMHNVSYRNMVDLFLLSHRVDVYEVLAQQTKYAKKGLVYADQVHHSMGLSVKHISGLQSRFFIRRQDLFLSSNFLFRLSWLLTYLFTRFWSSYIKNAIGIFVSKQIRKSVFRSLSDPTWYKLHIQSWFITINQNFYLK